MGGEISGAKANGKCEWGKAFQKAQDVARNPTGVSEIVAANPARISRQHVVADVRPTGPAILGEENDRRQV